VGSPEKDDLTETLLDKSHSNLPADAGTATSTLISSYILLIALSVHSVLEGIAVGVQITIESAVELMIAILIHKLVESLALGVSFAKSNAKKHQSIIMMLIFGLATPIGVLIGMALISTSINGIDGIFNALAAGTFLYVGASEIVVEEFSVTKYATIKYICFLAGLGAIFAIMLSGGH
jgi:zinc transporter 1/2/3